MELIRKCFSKIKKRTKKDQVELLIKHGLKVGSNFNMYGNCIDFGHCFLVEIGNDVTITNCTILAHDASIKKQTGYSKVGKVIIGDRCFIGWGSIILPNVKIGNDVIVGAGAVVTKDVPNNSIVAGNPAKVIGNTQDYIAKHKNSINKKPTFDVYWPYKDIEEINKMQCLLDNTIGYDK